MTTQRHSVEQSQCYNVVFPIGQVYRGTCYINTCYNHIRHSNLDPCKTHTLSSTYPTHKTDGYIIQALHHIYFYIRQDGDMFMDVPVVNLWQELITMTADMTMTRWKILIQKLNQQVQSRTSPNNNTTTLPPTTSSTRPQPWENHKKTVTSSVTSTHNMITRSRSSSVLVNSLSDFSNLSVSKTFNTNYYYPVSNHTILPHQPNKHSSVPPHPHQSERQPQQYIGTTHILRIRCKIYIIVSTVM